MDGGFGYNVGVQAVAEIDGVDIIAAHIVSVRIFLVRNIAYHSRSLYMMVKKTCRKRLTAFMRTASRYNHASPDILKLVETSLGLRRSAGTHRTAARTKLRSVETAVFVPD
jgi:hypothetical protein